MQRTSLVTVAALVILAGAACNDKPLATSPGAAPSDALLSVSGSPRDHAALEQIVSTLDQAWTAGDAVTYAGQYAGARWIGPTGLTLTDPNAIRGLYTGLFTVTAFAGTTRQSIIRNITFLTGTIAVLEIDARVTGFSTLPPGITPWQTGTIRAIERNVVIKRGGEWQIVMHQATSVAPGVP
jgi:hypothetical protein